MVEFDFDVGVGLRHAQNTGLVCGGCSAEQDLEGPWGGGTQLLERLIGREIEVTPRTKGEP